MSEPIIGSVGVAVVPNAERFWEDFKAKTRAGAEEGIKVKVRADTKPAEEDLAALKAKAKLADTKVKVKADTSDAVRDIGLLKLAIIGLGPALIPIGVAGIAGLGALTEAAGAAVLAFKGVNAEIKAGTPLGLQWQGTLHGLTADLSVLETTASRAFLGGISGGIHQANAALPQFAGQVQRIGTLTGDIANHGIGAVIAAFKSLDPLFTQFLGYVDKGAAGLERWAQGGGLNSFVAWAQANLPVIGKDLLQVGKLVGQIIGAEAPQGLTILNTLGGLSHILSDVMVVAGPLAPAITDVYLAMALYGKLGPAIASLKAFAAAQAEAGAAGAAGGLKGFAGGAASLAAKVAPYAVAALAAAFAVNSADKATQGWAYSSSGLERGLHNAASAVNNLVHLHFGAAWAAESDVAFKAFVKTRGQIAAVQAEIQRVQVRVPLAPIKNPFADTFDAARSQAFAASVNDVTKAYKILDQQVRSGPISGAGEQWNSLQSAVQKNVDKTDAFLKLGGPTVTVIDGISVSQKTWNAALQQTGGDGAKALGLIQGMTEGMIRNRATINGLIVDQQRLSLFTLDVGSKYGLTAVQVDTYAAALGLTADAITKTVGSEQTAEKVLGAVAKTFANGNTATQGWLAAVQDFQSGADDLTARVKLLGAGLTALQGVTLTQAGANLSAVDSTEKLAGAIHDNSKSIGTSGELLGQLTKTTHGYVVLQPKLTQGSLEVQQAMAGAGTSAIQLAQSIYANTNNANLAYQAYEGLRAQFVSTATQSGLTAKQAQNLATQIYGVPKDAKTFVGLLNKDNTTKAIQGLTKSLQDFNKIIATATLVAHGQQPQSVLDGLLAQIGGFQGTHTAELVVAQSFVTSGVPLSALAGTGTAGAPLKPGHRASGGPITDGTSGTADDVLIRASKGEYVVNAAQTAKHYDLIDSINKGVKGFAGGGYVPPSLYVPGVGTDTATGEPKKSGGKSTVNVSGSITIRAGGGAAYSIAQVIKGNIPEAALAAKDLSRAVNEAFQLGGVQKQLTNAQNKLRSLTTDAANLRSSLTSSLSSSVDATKYGDVGGLLGAFQSQTGANSTFASELGKLSKEHLSAGLLQQLAAAGPSAGLDTLANASGAEINQVNAAYNAYAKSANSAAAIATSSVYAGQLAAERAIAAKDQALVTRMSNDVARLVAAVARVTNRPVTVTLNGHEVAHAVVKDAAFQGVLNDITKHLVY